MTTTNIHNCEFITPEVHINDKGKGGWITLTVHRRAWDDGKRMEGADITLFSEDVRTMAADLSEMLREWLAVVD